MKGVVCCNKFYFVNNVYVLATVKYIICNNKPALCCVVVKCNNIS